MRRVAELGLRAQREGHHVVMIVSDDGVGFDATAATDSAERHGLGMVTMRERSQAVGGRFDVHTRPGHGTRIEIHVPT